MDEVRNEEEIDTVEVQISPPIFTHFLKWISVIAALTGLVSYGAWIGFIQESINTMRKDCDDNKARITSNRRSILEAETKERDRFDKLIEALRVEFEEGNNELWELKGAIGLIQLEMRYRHGESSRNLPSVDAPPSMALPKRRPTKLDVAKVAKRADKAVENITKADSKDPLAGLSL